MAKPRIEIVFKRGKPTVAFFHLREVGQGKTGRQIPIRPTFVAHYDDAGHPCGMEVQLPLVATVFHVNEALRELGGSPVEEVDLLPLRAGKTS